MGANQSGTDDCGTDERPVAFDARPNDWCTPQRSCPQPFWGSRIILLFVLAALLLAALLPAALLRTALLPAALLRTALLRTALLPPTLLLAPLLRTALLLETLLPVALLLDPLLRTALLLETLLPAALLPPVPAFAAAPAKSSAPGIAAPVKARPVPTVVVPTISPPAPKEDLRFFDHVEAVERGAQHPGCDKRSCLDGIGHRPARDQHDRCRQYHTDATHRFLPKLSDTGHSPAFVCVNAQPNS
jgi:hypothetical protein